MIVRLESLSELGVSVYRLVAVRLVVLDSNTLEPHVLPSLQQHHLVANLRPAPRASRQSLPHLPLLRIRLVHRSEELHNRLGDPPPWSEEALEPPEVSAMFRQSEDEVRVRFGGGEGDPAGTDDRVVLCGDGEDGNGGVVEDVTG